MLLPSTVIFVLLARPVVTVLLSYGHFGAADVTITAATVAGLAWGIVGFSVYLYVLRGFYALRDTRTPFFINLVENGLTLVFAFLFVRGTDSGVAGPGLGLVAGLRAGRRVGASSCCAGGSGRSASRWPSAPPSRCRGWWPPPRSWPWSST